MVSPDPVDVRLLSLVAEVGRAAVHEVAARLGMDPREVASRLVTLSANGLPLVVGVECDPNGIRAALAGMAPPAAYPPNTPPGPSPVYGTPSGVYPPNTPSGQSPVYGTPSGVYPPSPVHGTPSGAYSPPAGTPSGAYQVQGTPSGPYPGYPQQQSHPFPAQQPVTQPQPGPPFPPQPGPPSTPFPAQQFPQSHPFPAQQPLSGQQPAVQAPPAISTWGPPQTASWARGDQPPQQPAAPTRPPVRAKTGVVGATLETEGLEGEYLAIQLVEVVDPADFLFTAAGYRLQEGERSVVVHTELVNRGSQPFNSLPDMYLVLVTPDGRTISKAPVSLSSRPPHRIGVAPGETAGGHTVYVLPENVEVNAVRWSARPDDTARTLTWTIER